MTASIRFHSQTVATVQTHASEQELVYYLSVLQPYQEYREEPMLAQISRPSGA